MKRNDLLTHLQPTIASSQHMLAEIRPERAVQVIEQQLGNALDLLRAAEWVGTTSVPCDGGVKVRRFVVRWKA